MNASSPTASAHDPQAGVPKSVIRKAIGASAIGNATEWFDYGVYAVAVTYIKIGRAHV